MTQNYMDELYNAVDSGDCCGKNPNPHVLAGTTLNISKAT